MGLRETSETGFVLFDPLLETSAVGGRRGPIAVLQGKRVSLQASRRSKLMWQGSGAQNGSLLKFFFPDAPVLLNSNTFLTFIASDCTLSTL